jgi:beta-glucanase (GH16 family)
LKRTPIIFFTFLFLFSCGEENELPNFPPIVDDNTNIGIGNNDTLVWEEEFDDNSGVLNPAIWTIEKGDGCPNLCGWGNQEKQYYREENIEVSNGTLKIKARKESYAGRSFTSARIKTQGKYNFTYGKAEIKAKLPQNTGSWPAIWLLGESISFNSWPFCGEIDIMEQRGQPSDKSYVLGTVHWNDGSIYKPASHSVNSGSIENLSSEWHVYTMDWTEDYIKISVDDEHYYRFNTNDTMPFDAPFFFVLNVAIGGTLGGVVDPNFSEDIMEIDYIRVYQ